jgi:hypothetical protein
MTETLAKYSPETAAGILARAALALQGEGNPAATPKVADEEAIRSAILREGRTRLGVALEDNRPEILESLGDWLDQQSDILTGPPDVQSALARLAQRGDLPSDLYQIIIVPQIEEVYARNFAFERQLIEKTVSSPDQEQHYGVPRHNANEPVLISLFLRAFRTPWPFKDFIMLVGGNRQENGLILYVHQAWRIYPSLVDITGAGSPVEMLQRFNRVFGADIDVNGVRGRFFTFLDQPVTSTLPAGPPKISVSQFSQHDPATGAAQSALVVATNLDLYRATLKKMAVRSDQIRS